MTSGNLLSGPVLLRAEFAKFNNTGRIDLVEVREHLCEKPYSYGLPPDCHISIPCVRACTGV